SRTPLWLRERGLEAPTETAEQSALFYVTRHYRLRHGESFPGFRIPIVASLDYLSVLVFPGDNGHFQISLALSAGDPYGRRLLSAEAFERFLTEVPLAIPWLERSAPVGEPLSMGVAGNCRRALLHGGRPFVTGLALQGDACMQTNPTTGRGISVAL